MSRCLIDPIRARILPALGAVFLIALNFALPAAAQPSLRLAVARAGDADFGPVPQLRFGALDRAMLTAEDEAGEATGAPRRFAIAHPVSMTPDNSGHWDRLADGTLRWRTRIVAAEARSLNFGFERYVMPPGGRLSIYSADGTRGLEVFTAADNRDHGELWTPILQASDAVLEVTLPEAERSLLELRLGSINQGYRAFGGSGRDATELEKSGSCNVDVICPEGDAYRDVIRSVAVFTVSGTGVCTGAMINNTAQNFRPLFLTADHCEISTANDQTIVTYWLFENSTCRAPGSGASGANGDGGLGKTISGATLLATYAPTDFTLIELSSSPPSGHRVFWAGWDRSSATPANAFTVHHPNGDEKRISFENQALQVTSYGSTSPPGNSTHLRVVDWDLGTTEPGSSGGPLFNSAKRIIGQLHGGAAACGNNQSDWFGRLASSWTGGGTNGSRLSNWLDPLGTGVASLGGTQPGASGGVPAAPTGLTAVTQSTTEVRLEWNDNANDETQYRIEVRPAGGSFTDIGSVPANSNAAIVTNLSPGVAYQFRVRARNAAGNSGYSNVASATTSGGGGGAPIAPANLVAQALNPSTVRLDWTDRSGNETSFEIQARAVARISSTGLATVFLNGAFQTLGTVGANVVAANVNSLDPSVVYNFRIRAVNNQGASAYTKEAAATPEASSAPANCGSGSRLLCLRGGRFRVQTFWNNFRQPGSQGDAFSINGTDQSGYFWFFNSSNIELVVKILDGTVFNPPFYWTFYGALSDVEYWIVVTDTQTGNRKTYYNEPRRLCGELDTRSLPPSSGLSESASMAELEAMLGEEPPVAALEPPVIDKIAACTSNGTTLCLLGGRFSARVQFRNPNPPNQQGQAGAVTSGNDRTGFFWFFNQQNIELVVKMLDGRASNGHFWVLWGALSNVQYDITVVDTVTGASKTYHSPQGNTCGGADTTAFDG